MKTKLLSRVLIATVVFIAALFGLSLYYLKTADLKEHIDLFTPVIQRATGRELTVAGDIVLNLSWTPTMILSEVTLSNADWATETNMISIPRVEAEVHLLSLLMGDLRFLRISATGTRVELETNADGRTNFTFSEAGPGDSTAGRLPTLGDFQLRDTEIRFLDGGSGRVHHWTIAGLNAQAESDDAPLRLEFDGHYEQTDIRGTATITPYGGLLGSDTLDFELGLYGAGAEVHALGQIFPADGWTGSHAGIEISGSDLTTLGTLAGLSVPAAKDYSVDFDLNVPQAQSFQIRDLKVKIDESDLAGEATVDLAGSKPHLSAAFTSQQIRIRLPVVDADKGPGKSSAKVFSSDQIDASYLEYLESDGSLHMAKLILDDLVVEDLSATWSLEANRLRLHPLAATAAGGRINADISIAHEGRNLAVTFAANGKSIDLGTLSRQLLKEEALHGAPAAIDIDLRSNGGSPATLAAHLNGDARILVSEGRAQVELLNSVVGGATKLVGTMFADGSTEAKINCAASNFRLEKGLATSQVFLVDTEFATVYGTGTVDLAKERLDMEFKPVSKSATLNVAVPVEATGPLSNPEFTPSKLATARKATGLLVLAGIVFPPAAILGLGGLAGGAVVVGGLGEMGQSGNPCIDLASGKTQKPPGAKPQKQTQPEGEAQSEGETLIEETGKQVREAVEGIGNTIKGLFGD